MREKFIKSLKDWNIPISESLGQFEQLINEKAFEAFKPDLVSMKEKHSKSWTENYFKNMIRRLEKSNFSQEIAKHLIEVKKELKSREAERNRDIQPETISGAIDSPLSYSETNLQAGESHTKFANSDSTGFKPNQELLSALEKGDLAEIRDELMCILDSHRLTIEEIRDSIEYVCKNKPEVFVAEEKSVFVKEIDNVDSNWNVDYFNLQKGYLNYNFTLSRLLHLVTVRKTLMERGDKHFQQIEIKRPKQTISPDSTGTSGSKTNTEKPKNNNIAKWIIIGGVVVLGALFALFKSYIFPNLDK